MTGHRAARRARSSKKSKRRLAYRVGEWSQMTGTSRVTTWRKIKNKTLKTIDYDGITLIPHSEAVRLQLADT
jgi:hypothetical protein